MKVSGGGVLVFWFSPYFCVYDCCIWAYPHLLQPRIFLLFAIIVVLSIALQCYNILAFIFLCSGFIGRWSRQDAVRCNGTVDSASLSQSNSIILNL